MLYSPTEIAAPIADLRGNSPANLAGIVWFDLPTDENRREWSIAIWRAVMLGKPLHPRIEATSLTAV